jgi:hypothetical protein
MQALLRIASVLTISIFLGFPSMAISFFIAMCANTFSNLDERIFRIHSAASSNEQPAIFAIKLSMQSTIDFFVAQLRTSAWFDMMAAKRVQYCDC